MNRPVFLLLGHRLDARTLKAYRRLAAAVADHATLQILFHAPDGQVPAAAADLPLWTFSDADLAAIGFPLYRPRIVPGSTHYPVLLYARANPDHSHYWVIEYDVHFAGDWRVFFDYFANNDADLLASHLRRFDEEPDWRWWRLDHPEQTIPLPARWRAFHPVYRLSAAALAHIDAAHRQGWAGHYEMLVPTLLSAAGYRLQDFGGSGSLVAAGDHQRFYRDDASADPQGRLRHGSMRWRPCVRFPYWPRNRLYHPVK